MLAGIEIMNFISKEMLLLREIIISGLLRFAKEQNKNEHSYYILHHIIFQYINKYTAISILYKYLIIISTILMSLGLLDLQKSYSEGENKKIVRKNRTEA